MSANRFDYVAYDADAQKMQNEMKASFMALEALCESLPGGRAKALVLTSLEVAYMWVGKAIRDGQIARNGSAPLQEGRGNE